MGERAPAGPGTPSGVPGPAGASFGAFWGQVCAVRWPLEGRLGLGAGWTGVGGWTGLQHERRAAPVGRQGGGGRG